MATVLVVAPLFDRAFLAASWKEVLRQRGWVYAAIVPSLVIVLVTERAILNPAGTAAASAGFAMQGVTPWEYFRTQPEIILHYLGLACLPRQLIFDYAWPVQNDLLRAGLSGLIVTAIFVGSVLLYIRRPIWGFAALSFFLILGPTSSFMPIADLAVEHRMYLPLIAVCLAMVFLGNAWLERLVASESTRQRLAFSLAIVALVVLSLRTYVRNEDYRQPIRLYAQNVYFNPANRRAHNNLALELRARGLNDEARQHFLAAVKLDPRHPHAYYQLGLLAAEKQDFEAALKFFQQSLERAPDDRAAEYCCGLCFMELRRDAEAAAAFERSLKIDARNAVAQRELAWVLATSEDESIRNGELSLKLAQELAPQRPNDPRLLEVLAAANAEVGKYHEATATAEKALATAERSGWAGPKRAALAAAIQNYREEKPLRRAEVAPSS
jgi:tetratricopeptide (TPR) repeat protein